MSFLMDPNEVNPATVQWFKDNTLFGFMADRERWRTNGYTLEVGDNVVPWFGRKNAGTDDAEYKNGFPGPVPIEAINERLFNWTVEEAPVFMLVPARDDEVPDVLDAESRGFRYVELDTRKAVYRSDTRQDFEVFKTGYLRHQFSEWLLTKVEHIVGDELAVESAALLKQGAVAFVSVSLPDTVQGDAKFPLLIKLVAFTSHDGSLGTTYILSAESPVCSNSFAGVRTAAKGHGKRYTARHTKGSVARIADIHQALGLVHQHTEETVRFFDLLADWEVTGKDVHQVIDAIEPVPEQVTDSKGRVTNQRAITTAETRQDEIAELYVQDARVKPWQGTALGVMQAFNTWDQQVRGVKGVRAERQMLKELSGEVAEFDSIVMDTLADVTGWSIVRENEEAALELVRVGES